MIIVSQDKKRIVNFDNLTQIYITHCEEDNAGYFIRFETVDSLYEDLGECATEERAKEVLQEIIERYDVLKKNTTYAQGDGGFTFNEHYYYEMPEK